MSDIITLTQVLEDLKNNKGPHSLSYTTLDMKRNSGGQYVTMKNAVLLKHSDQDHDENVTYDPKGRPHKKSKTNHSEHLILLFKDLDRPLRKVIEVHGRLISVFNGKLMRYGK